MLEEFNRLHKVEHDCWRLFVETFKDGKVDFDRRGKLASMYNQFKIGYDQLKRSLIQSGLATHFTTLEYSVSGHEWIIVDDKQYIEHSSGDCLYRDILDIPV